MTTKQNKTKFSWGLCYQCACSYGELQPTPTSPGGPLRPLGRSLVPTVGTVGAAQILTWPSSHMFLSPNSTAGKARLVSVVGALFVHSDIPQMQGLPSQS